MADMALEILMKILSDTVGGEKAQEVLAKVKREAGEGGPVAARLAQEMQHMGQESETAAGHAEHLHISHRALHQILHLIAHETGPMAGAAISGLVSIAAGGGIMIGVMAIRQLAEAFKQMGEEAEKAREKVREAYIETSKQSEEATRSVKEAAEQIDKFFKGLDEKIGEQMGKQSFKNWVDSFKTVADAAVKSGLTTKGEADNFVDKHTEQADKERIKGIDHAIKAWTESLEKAREATLKSVFDHGQIAALKADLATAEEAYKSGKKFEPLSPNLHKVDFGATYPGESTEDAEARRKTEIGSIQDTVKKIIEPKEKGIKELSERIASLEGKISAANSEKAGLQGNIDKSQVKDASTDFVHAKAIADVIQKGGQVSKEQAEFLRVVETVITGKSQSLADSVKLIEAQSKKDDFMLILLQNNITKLTNVQARLDALERKQ